MLISLLKSIISGFFPEFFCIEAFIRPRLHQHLNQGTPVHGVKAVEQLDNIILTHSGDICHTAVLLQILKVSGIEEVIIPHIMRLLISLWDVGTVFFTIYPQVFRHEKSSIYYKYIEPLSYCFSISFKILIITVYGFMKWYICKCLFCKVYLLDLSYNRNAKPMTGSNELRFNLTQIRG